MPEPKRCPIHGLELVANETICMQCGKEGRYVMETPSLDRLLKQWKEELHREMNPNRYTLLDRCIFQVEAALLADTRKL